MNKIKNGQDKGTLIPPPVRANLDQHCSFIEFQNKSVIAKANRAGKNGASTYFGGSIYIAAHFEKMIILLYFYIFIYLISIQCIKLF